MSTHIPRSVFVNLPVADLPKSTAFWKELGFTFNQQFSDENATCMVLSEHGYVMLLSYGHWKRFTDKPITDLRTSTAGMVCLSCVDRAEVDSLTDRAIALGATGVGERQDYGFMVQRAFEDFDGHHWEVMYMDPSFVKPV